MTAVQKLPRLRIDFTGEHKGSRAIGIVAEDFWYTLGDVSGCVPAGFKSDLESIPWFLQFFIPRGGRLLRPSIIHDERVSNHGFSHAANRLMLAAMHAEGFRDLRKYLIASGLWLHTSFKTGRLR